MRDDVSGLKDPSLDPENRLGSIKNDGKEAGESLTKEGSGEGGEGSSKEGSKEEEVVVKEEPNRSFTLFIGNGRYKVTQEQHDKYISLSSEVNLALGDRLLGDVSTDKDDPYNQAKKALEAFLHGLHI